VSTYLIDLVTPDGGVIYDTTLAQDYSVQKIVGELVELLTLPIQSGTDAVSYSLVCLKRNVALDPAKTLSDAGVSNGDRLQLTASRDVGPTIGSLPTKPGPGSVVEVLLKLPDKGDATVKEVLELDVPIENLLGGLVKTHGLQVLSDVRREPIGYEVYSKVLGRDLLPRETLRDANVPEHDTLTLHRELIAG
jgi:hypothetical protein